MVDASLAEIQSLREQLAAAREVAAEVARIKAINADLEARNALLELQNEKMRRALRISEVLDTHFAKSWTSVSQSPGQLTRFGRGCLVEFQAEMISAFSPWVKRDGARVLRMLSPSRAMR